MHICLNVLVGIPGVGKTHLCEFIMKNLQSPLVRIHHISYDDCEADLPSNIYKNFRKNVYNKVRNYIETIAQINDQHQYILLIDDNMYYRSMRRAYYNLAKYFQISYCQIFVSCSVETALERNNNRVDRVPCSVINDMSNKLEVPVLNNTWEKYSITIDSQFPFSSHHVEIIRKLFTESLLDPVLKQEQINTTNHASLFHTIDLALRKIVNRLLKERSDKSAASQEYIVKKNSILSGLKSGDLHLPEFQSDELLYEFLLNIMCNITK